jgi:hypothetical protein
MHAFLFDARKKHMCQIKVPLVFKEKSKQNTKKQNETNEKQNARPFPYLLSRTKLRQRVHFFEDVISAATQP